VARTRRGPDDADVDLALDGIVCPRSGRRVSAARPLRASSHITASRTILSQARRPREKLRLGHGLESTNGRGTGRIEGGAGQGRELHADRGRGRRAIAAGGRVPTEGALAKGFCQEPTVLVDVKPNMRVAQEEIFGPVTSVIE